MSKKFILYAPQIHSGGGLVLLNEVLTTAPSVLRATAIIDDRASKKIKIHKDWTQQLISGSFFGRMSAEFSLFKNIKNTDTVLFFSNLPPFFKVRGKTILFLQNRYLIDHVTLKKWPRIKQINFLVQRFWLRRLIKNCSLVIVQTNSMKRIFRENINNVLPIDVISLASNVTSYPRKLLDIPSMKNKNDKFAYIASGDPHKNHLSLIEALVILSKELIYPTLYLTLDVNNSFELLSHIENTKEKYNINVVNKGFMEHDDVLLLYKEIDALIFPSELESFGLPLIEARLAGLPIIASELDYVRDVVDPEYTFNPSSPQSIARAIKRFMLINDDKNMPENADSFFSKILDHFHE